MRKPLSRTRFLEIVEGIQNGELVEVTYKSREPRDLDLVRSEPFYFGSHAGDSLNVIGYKQHMRTEECPKFFGQGQREIPRSDIYDIRRLAVREEASV